MGLSKRQRFEILRRDGHRCKYCGRTADEVKITVDHVTPIALGGTNVPENLAAACSDCNNGKSSVPADAAMVAEVADDAMRWAVAWKQASSEMGMESTQKSKAADKVKARLAKLAKESYGRPLAMPGDAAASVIRWIELGLPIEKINELADYTVSRRNIPLDGKWRYFSGCCWSALRQIEERTRQILGEDDPEPSADTTPPADGGPDRRVVIFCHLLGVWQWAWLRASFTADGPSEAETEAVADVFWMWTDDGTSARLDLTEVVFCAGTAHSTDAAAYLPPEPAANPLAALSEEEQGVARNLISFWTSRWEAVSDDGGPMQRDCAAFTEQVVAAIQIGHDHDWLLNATDLAGGFMNTDLAYYLPKQAPAPF